MKKSFSWLWLASLIGAFLLGGCANKCWYRAGATTEAYKNDAAACCSQIKETSDYVDSYKPQGEMLPDMPEKYINGAVNVSAAMPGPESTTAFRKCMYYKDWLLINECEKCIPVD